MYTQQYSFIHRDNATTSNDDANISADSNLLLNHFTYHLSKTENIMIHILSRSNIISGFSSTFV